MRVEIPLFSHVNTAIVPMQIPSQSYFGIWTFYLTSLGLNSASRHINSHKLPGAWSCLLCLSVYVGGHNFTFSFTEPLIKLLPLNIKSNCVKITSSTQEGRIRTGIGVNGSCTWMAFPALPERQIPKDAAGTHQPNTLCKYPFAMSQFLHRFQLFVWVSCYFPLQASHLEQDGGAL